MTLANLQGKVFTYLTVMHREPKKNMWLCLCACGKNCLASTRALRTGGKRSCGCKKSALIREARRTHGMTGTSTYHCWRSMLWRCNSVAAPNYALYGGRGIKVCARWHKFENFLADMGEMPESMQLDRINNGQGYSPKNCRWATRRVQANNRRSNVTITYNGVTKTIAEWSVITGLKDSTVRARIRRGWPPTKTLATPLRSSLPRAHKALDIRVGQL